MIPEALLNAGRRHLVTIDGKARLTEAARLFADPATRLLVVCDQDNRMIGVLSRTDIVSRIGRCTGGSCAEPVEAAMTRDVVSCSTADKPTDILERMKATGHKNLPLIESDGRPIGIVAAPDVLEFLLEDPEREESLLFDYVMGIGYR